MSYIGSIPAIENISQVPINSVETQDIQNSAVTTEKIANAAVTADKIAAGAAVPTQTGQTGKYLTTDGTSASWATLVAGPSISSLAYSGNDQATDTTSPLPVTIIGSGFVANTKVYIDTVTNANSATALQFSGTTQITFTPPAKSAASYNVWVVTPDGKMAVLVNGILYSGTPNWAGVSTTYTSQTAVNIQLTATSVDTPLVYSLVSGTLPTGVTLSSGGLLSGTVTGLTADTSFPNIVIRANDPQNQDASVTIQLNIIVQHPISRSLRFSNEDSTYLTRTPASAGNRQRWTFSYWIKRNRVQSAGFWDWVLSTPTNSGILINYDASTYFYNITFYDYGGTTSLQWLGNFRDLSAWYHIVLAFDSTQATDTNRVKCYVNGVQLTQMSSPAPTWPTLNYQTSFNDTVEHNIGRWNWNGGSRYMDAYLAEINWVDGLALTPSSFGQVNLNKNVWEPRPYTGTYGTNGYYLNFSDNSNTTATTLGKDNSGNSNNWTPNNFSITAGIDNDSLVDTPTNYGTDSGLGGEVRGNYCTLNPLTTSAGTYSRGNLRYISTSTWRRSTGTIAVSSGKWYWEVRIANNPHSRASTADWHGFGVCLSSSLYLTANSAVQGDSLYLSDTGWYKNFNGGLTDSGVGFAAGDIISLAIDLDANTFTYRKNNVSIVTGTIGGTPGRELVPMVNSYDGSYGIMDFNFGQRPFAYTAPSGFKALCAQNLPTPSIGNTSSTTANKFFNIYTWTGNGTNPRQHTGIGFRPDFVWIYRRDVSYGNWIYDSVRGVTKALKPNSNEAESTYGQVSSFDSDGFTQTGLEDQGNNINGGQYIAYLLKAGDTAVTNTQGSITSTVCANTTNGFSIVRYNGISANATIGHGLGVAPKMIIRKYVNDTDSWYTYHASLGADKYLALNETTAATTSTAIWQNTAPTSTVFSIGSGNNNSNSVAYCFAEVPGFSAFGSYTGNGSTNGPFVHLGFRPAFVLIKSTSTGAWCIHDTKRNPQNGSHLVLQVNGTSAEGTFTRVEAPDLLSNGFRINFSYGDYNTNGVQYIYMAFAETPFKHALAR